MSKKPFIWLSLYSRLSRISALGSHVIAYSRKVGGGGYFVGDALSMEWLFTSLNFYTLGARATMKEWVAEKELEDHLFHRGTCTQRV